MHNMVRLFIDILNVTVLVGGRCGHQRRWENRWTKKKIKKGGLKRLEWQTERNRDIWGFQTQEYKIVEMNS